MSEHIDKLRSEYEKAEQAAQKIMAEKDAARDRFNAELREATIKAADAQKDWMDAEAAAALVGRDDAEETAARLGLTLPDE